MMPMSESKLLMARHSCGDDDVMKEGARSGEALSRLMLPVSPYLCNENKAIQNLGSSCHLGFGHNLCSQPASQPAK